MRAVLPQMMARQNPTLATTRSWLNRLWTFEKNGTRYFEPDRQFNYADRIRRREPGDNTLGLSPHSDGGSVERWCEPTFRFVYREVFEGDPLAFDATIVLGGAMVDDDGNQYGTKAHKDGAECVGRLGRRRCRCAAS